MQNYVYEIFVTMNVQNITEPELNFTCKTSTRIYFWVEFMKHISEATGLCTPDTVRLDSRMVAT